MKTQKSIPMLVLIALAAAVLGFVMGSDDAHAATKLCTPAQTYQISQQQRTVDDRQRTADQKQREANNAQRDANNANTKVNNLAAAKVNSAKRVAQFLKLAAQNLVSSPSIARGYQEKAKAEQNNYNSLERQHLAAVKSAEAANQKANRAMSLSEQSQRNLRTEQARLATQKSRCR